MQKKLFCHHQNAGKKTIPGVYDNIMFGSLKKSNDFFCYFILQHMDMSKKWPQKVQFLRLASE